MRNKVIVGVIIAIAVTAGGVYLVTKNRASVEGGVSTTGGSKQLLEASLASGGGLKCTFKDDTDASKPSGTRYLADGKIRTDVDPFVHGGVTQSGFHELYEVKTSYNWTDDGTEGQMVNNLDVKVNGHLNTDAAMKEEIRLHQNFIVQDENCEPWTVDASVFVPPANMKFADYTSLTEEIIANENARTTTNTPATNTNKEPMEKTYSAPTVLPESERTNKQARIVTNKGTIVFELLADAPLTASNFITLANGGYYDGLTFHRVVADFVIQGGDPDGIGTGGPGYKFKDEPVKRAYDPGIVAMANSGPNTNGSQFFIMLPKSQGLPPLYTIFGKVTSGMDVVAKIVVGDVMTKVTIEDKK